MMRRRMTRRSDSSWVSPGPRVPIPPEVDPGGGGLALLPHAVHDGGAGRGGEPPQLVERLFDPPATLRRQLDRRDHRSLALGAGQYGAVATPVLHPIRPPSRSRRSSMTAAPSGPPASARSSHWMSGSRVNHVHCRLA